MMRITDARGRKVTQLDPVALHLMRRHDIIEADVLRSIANEKGVRIAPLGRLWLIGGIVVDLLIGGLVLQSVITGDFATAPYARIAAMIYFAAVPWIPWFRAKYLRFASIAPAMLKHGRCPHCGYDLRELPADEEDGATICPECGCVWKVGGEEPQVSSSSGDDRRG
jgi:hypothetical protein